MLHIKSKFGNQDVFQSKNAFSKLFLELNFMKKNDDRKRKKFKFDFTVPYYPCRMWRE